MKDRQKTKITRNYHLLTKLWKMSSRDSGHWRHLSKQRRNLNECSNRKTTFSRPEREKIKRLYVTRRLRLLTKPRRYRGVYGRHMISWQRYFDVDALPHWRYTVLLYDRAQAGVQPWMSEKWNNQHDLGKDAFMHKGRDFAFHSPQTCVSIAAFPRRTLLGQVLRKVTAASFSK